VWASPAAPSLRTFRNQGAAFLIRVPPASNSWPVTAAKLSQSTHRKQAGVQVFDGIGSILGAGLNVANHAGAGNALVQLAQPVGQPGSVGVSFEQVVINVDQKRRVWIDVDPGTLELLALPVSQIFCNRGCDTRVEFSFPLLRASDYNAAMSPSDQASESLASPPSQFVTTHWSMVLAAKDRDSPQAREALAGLCATYWYPLYAFVRRQGNNAEDAQDLTQEFFARLLETDFLRAVERSKGQFRSFLLACCKHFLSNERDRAGAQKRGGGRLQAPLNFEVAESKYTQESALPAEKLFERRWALTLLDQVLIRLREEFIGLGKKDFFERLKVYLTGDRSGLSYEEFGKQFGMTEGAVKVAVHRLRRRYRELLREEIGRTVDGAEQVENEIRELFTILGS
jgi:RNA polymerase sigma factor (sigma-70 family)